jgi:hypothetical protein
MGVRNTSSIAESGSTPAEEPTALIAHGGVCEGGGLVS